MGYEHSERETTSTPTISPPGGGTPGKRTRTDRIPGQPRDADYETICDDAPDGPESDDPNCPLSPEMRGRQLAELGDGFGNAMANYRDAIQDRRIELLTTTESGYGALADFLFYEISGPLVVIGTRAAMRFASRAAARALEAGHARGSAALKRLGARMARTSVREDRIRGFLVNVSRGARTAIKNLAHSAGDQGKAVFLQVMRAQISVMRLAVREEARGVYDPELQALAAGYDDVEAHSVEAYSAAIDDILARYDSNHMDDVGQAGRKRANSSPSGDERSDRRYEEIQRGRLAWTTSGRMRRLALLSYVDDERSFRHFIDQDFESLAVALYLERMGRAPDEINLDTGTQTNGATSCPWAHSARLSMAWCTP